MQLCCSCTRQLAWSLHTLLYGAVQTCLQVKSLLGKLGPDVCNPWSCYLFLTVLPMLAQLSAVAVIE